MSSDEPANLSLTDLADALYADESPARFSVRRFALWIQANRLIEFGFEDSINRYSPKELVLLATCMPARQQEQIFDIAIKDKGIADVFNKLMGVTEAA
jgi:hypothetical protein